MKLFSLFVWEQIQARTNYLNTIYGVKRLIGRKFSEPEVQAEIASLPFKIVQVWGMVYHHF